MIADKIIDFLNAIYLKFGNTYASIRLWLVKLIIYVPYTP